MARGDPAAEAVAQQSAPPDEAALPPGAELYWDAFWHLTHDRAQSGFGVGAIPFSAIDAYARRIGVRDEDFSDFANLVRAADDEFVAVMAQRMKEEAKRK